MSSNRIRVIAFGLALLIPATARSESKEQWVELGARIHGAFGAFVPVGIRIGLDAKEKLRADARGLEVVYYTGARSPCPCIVDGVMLATGASPGQGTLQISPEKAPPGLLALIVIRNRKSGEGLRYTIVDEWLPRILAWNKSDLPSRYDSAMSADELFVVEPSK